MSGSLKKYILPDREKTLCNWQKVAVFFIVLAVSFVMLFFLIPIDSIAKSIIPDFDPKNESGTVLGPLPTLAPSIKPGAIDGRPTAQPLPTAPVVPITTKTPSPTPVTSTNTSISLDGVTTTPADENTRCPAGEKCCNGLVSNCRLRLNEVMYASLHNAMDTEEGGSIYIQNHLLSLEKAVEAGYRGLNLSVCSCRGRLQFCHGRCDYAYRDPEEVFQNLNDFLNDNESEILILVFEMAVGSIVVEEFYDIMNRVDGFTDKIYAHKDPSKSWPKMSQMLYNQKQIVMFEYGNVEMECTSMNCKKHLLKYFDHSVETSYSFKDENDIKNYLQSCAYDRGNGGSTAFYNVNNFVIPPKKDVSASINSYDSLKARLTTCAAINRNLPNLVFVDYWSIGDMLKITDDANEQIASSIARLATPGGLRLR